MTAEEDVSSQRLLCHINESPSRVLQLSELKEWWEGDRERRAQPITMKETLQGLVDRGVLGCRVIVAGGSEFTLYWLKSQGSQPGCRGNTATGGTLSHKPATPMSASLREKLKRSRRQFVSPLLSCSSSKKPRLSASADEPETEQSIVTKLDFTGCSTAQVESRSGTGVAKTGSTGTECGQITESGCAESGISRTESTEWSMKNEVTMTMETGCTKSEKGSGRVNKMMALVREREALQKELDGKEERLRKLRLVKMYRSKNDLEQLELLTSKWREASQEAAEELIRSSTHNPPPTMAQLLDHLRIDHTLIRYSTEDEAFY